MSTEMMEAMIELKSQVDEYIVMGITHKQRIHTAYAFVVTMGEKEKNTPPEENFTKCTEHAEQD